MSRKVKVTDTEIRTNGVNWFQEWFGLDYLRLYPHRDEAEAQRQVVFLVDLLPKAASLEVLDIGCGDGRHLAALSRAGLAATGLDLSAPLLQRAAARPENLRLVRSDMRLLPFATGRFGALTSFFTSFGYFPSDEDHVALATEFRRVTRTNGFLFIDFLNESVVRRELPRTTYSEDEHARYEQRRSLSADGLRVEKHITIVEKQTGRERCYVESVRLYTKHDLELILMRSGYTIAELWGDFTGQPPSSVAPRLLILAQAHEHSLPR
ncbi:MAG: class I SAM-dependent methyltransferase [Bdellovibrionales bacterium]|nr:class I SAM-dependent methyltransferase [Bdellovibrionales bacterium]